MGEVLPELKGKLDGVAIRVPTANVSLVDLKLVLAKSVDSNAVNSALREAANGALKGVLDYSTLPLVSVDFNHSPASSTVAADGTKVMDGDFVRVMSWYDNEWGFSIVCSIPQSLLARLCDRHDIRGKRLWSSF